MNYYKGETIIVTGLITQKDGSAFNLADFISFDAVVTDSEGTQLTYTSTGGSPTITVKDVDNSYKFIITEAQSATLAGTVMCKITASFASVEYGVNTYDIESFVIGTVS